MQLQIVIWNHALFVIQCAISLQKNLKHHKSILLSRPFSYPLQTESPVIKKETKQRLFTYTYSLIF